MKQTWAPWRMQYIKSEKEQGCIFCKAAESADDRQSLVLYRGEFNFVLMNKYPYNNGHLMIAPYRHTADPSALDGETGLELFGLIQLGFEVLKAAFDPQGFNAGLNLGKCAGAGILDHLHFHLVPRWDGDTNFMPVLTETRVISEHILSTYDTLLEHFKKGAQARKGE